MIRMLLFSGVVALAMCGVWLRQSGVSAAPQQAAMSRAQQNTAVLITMGLNAKANEQWDGRAVVSGGELVSATGRHFSDGDSVTPQGEWIAVTRRDAVAPYADIHYTEMRPGSTPAVLFQPVGVYLTVTNGASAQVSVSTKQGKFVISPRDLNEGPQTFLGGRVSVIRVPVPELVSSAAYENDEPSITATPAGGISVAWVGYKDRADRVFMRTLTGSQWNSTEEVTPQAGDIFRCSAVTGAGDSIWIFWSQRKDKLWQIWAREKRAGTWKVAQVISSAGSNTFHRAASNVRGEIAVVWQSFREGQSDIYLRVFRQGQWVPEVKLSESKANDWEPSVAIAADGSVHAAWDSYDKGNYDVFYRSWREGAAGPVRAVTTSPNFQAHTSIATDSQNRPWIAWNESGVNWGKDQGFLIPVPQAVPLHQERSIRLVMWDGKQWMEPTIKSAAFERNAEHPQIIFDGAGGLGMMFRKWTRRASRTIGSPMVWENYWTRFDGARWAEPQPLSQSGSWVEKHAGLARDAQGGIWAGWMTDNRPFSTMIPQRCDVYAARMVSAASSTQPAMAVFKEAFAEEIPVHNQEAEDVKSIRGYVIKANRSQYKIFRGDMHRHTDFSQDFKYDGSLIEVYRYARDAAGFDYIAPTDHQAGYDQEYSWWQGQKLVDLFLVSDSFVPLFAYERSLPYPNGHRNIVWSYRGIRTLPIPDAERDGFEGAKKLFEHLKQTDGISMPHSSATAQGTDWRDNDPKYEPLVEIYQGYRNSYEYEGAPKAASELNPHAQKSGWQPQGFYWNALDKGYKLGVQASSDHWSTHISYACLLVENGTREGLLDAIRKRHAYAATDNIVLDFRASSGGKTYLMGDSFESATAPRLQIHVGATASIKQIDIIRDKRFVFTSRPRTRQFDFEFIEKEFSKGKHWYYVRVMQEDGQMAWSSPVWVKN
jgi:hypothetical protein